MIIVIYNSESEFGIRLPEDKFKTINVGKFYLVEDNNDFLFKMDQDEYYAHKISESIDLVENNFIEAIVINKELGIDGYSRAIRLAGHIACNKFLRGPIIISSSCDLDIEDSTLKSDVINNFFQTEGFYFRNYEQLFSINDDLFSGKQFAIENEIGILKPISINNLSISPSRTSHQSTNEWGAMRLASNFGLLKEMEFNYPPHLYFKYIANFISDPNEKPELDKSLHNLFNKILLIDDNADCGWRELLEKIFNCKNEEVAINKNKHIGDWKDALSKFVNDSKSDKKIDKIITAEDLANRIKTSPQKFNEYDVIFLDLYLVKGSLDMSFSLTFLEFIKSTFPQIPVIIFTASDKAYNLDKILESGADGMYTKESPLHYNDTDYTATNYEDFKKTCLGISKKYKVLKPYWVNIQSILSNPTFKNVVNSQDRKCKSRIEERLKMFYGLLKKGYEQREYDKRTFYYSDIELAFITLWSVLIEIQEAFYTKTLVDDTISSNGSEVSVHPNNDKIKKILWQIDGIDFFCQKFKIKHDSKSNRIIGTDDYYALTKGVNLCNVVIDKSALTFSHLPQLVAGEDVTRSIQTQIAGLIIHKSNLKSSGSQAKFLFDLYSMNKIRNKLYFTHGDDAEDSEHYKFTEESKRQKSKHLLTDKIKDLFNLIAFLLTGDESIKVD